MRHLHLILIVLVTLYCVPPARAVTADQRISAVTVYPDRALITRSGTVMLPSGVQTVVFDHLPLNLEEDSVRARAESRTAMKILGIEMRRDYREVAPSADMQKLQDGVTKFDDQIRALTDEQGDLNKRSEFLDRLRDQITSTTRGGKTPNAQNIQSLFTMYSTETDTITARLREIDFSLRDLNKQRSVMAGQLALLQQPAQPNTRSALVTIDAGSGGSVAVDVTYIIGGASWQPQYDAYADADTKKVALTYYGVVRQTTGEDWNGVALTLSSSRPSVAARLPEMTPWTVDFARPVVYSDVDADEAQLPAGRASRMNVTAQPTTLSALKMAYANAPGSAAGATFALASPAPMADAQIQSLGPAASFVVPATTTIPSDNQPHRNAICVQTLKGEWTYEASPKLVDGAFLKTRVTNTSNGPLLGGEINVFLGNNFVGKSNIGLVAANASFDLFLGADDNIKLTRTEGVDKEETGGIITRQRVFKRSYVIEVQNFKATAIDLELHDQVPVSKNGDIAVRMDQVEPPIQTQNPNTGEVTWTAKIAPGQKQKFTVQYEVDAPYDKPITGV